MLCGASNNNKANRHRPECSAEGRKKHRNPNVLLRPVSLYKHHEEHDRYRSKARNVNCCLQEKISKVELNSRRAEANQAFDDVTTNITDLSQIPLPIHLTQVVTGPNAG